MKTFIRNLSLSFAAGCFGGLINTLLYWATSYFDLNKKFDIRIKPDFDANWLYAHVIFGGIWGLLFLIPILKESFFWRGILYSLIPSLIVLFFVIPLAQGLSGYKGNFSSELYLFIINALSGACAGLWLKATSYLKK